MHHPILLFAAGLLAGTMNAAAGGGSFVTFPALVYAGVPPLPANASSTVALFPGSIASTWILRGDIRPFPQVSMLTMILLTFSGGCSGALLLLHTPAASFSSLVPWLLLTGTLAFAFGRQAGNWLRQRFNIGKGTLMVCQFILGLYGGYFGGAVGIMMMAAWSLFGLADIKVINANKNLLVGIANSIAVILFIIAGKVYWPETCIMLVATVTGGSLGGRYAKRVDPEKLRLGIVLLNFVITAVFFIKTYVH